MRLASRLVFAGLLAASFAWVVSAGGAQIKPVAGVAQPPAKDKKDKKDKKDEKPPEEDNVPYTFPYNRDAKNQLDGARDYLKWKNIPWDTITPLLPGARVSPSLPSPYPSCSITRSSLNEWLKNEV